MTNDLLDEKIGNRTNKRPISISVISWLFLAIGSIGLAYHATEFKQARPFQYDIFLVCLVRVLAIFGAFFMLRGRNWARWLLLGWMAYHVILSAFHSLSELIIHGLLFAVIAYFLFGPKATAYFRRVRIEKAIPERLTDQ